MNELVAESSEIGKQELFQVKYLGSHKCTILSLYNKKFVSVDFAGDGHLRANREQVGEWEMFEVDLLHYEHELKKEES